MPACLDLSILAQKQAQDAELPHLLEAGEGKLQPLDLEGASLFCTVDGNVIRPYIPKDLRKGVFEALHGLSHPGVRSTTKSITQKYFWPRMRKEIARWARSCVPCQHAKVHRHNRAALGDFAAPDARFDHLHLDLIKLPSCSGFQYCLTIVDRFSRWPHAIPLPDQQAETVARAFFQQWISFFGTPLTITTDQGPQFEARLFAALANIIGAARVHTTPYHPQANGLVERMHRTLKAALMCCAPTPWPQALPAVLLGLRTTFKEDLQASPAEMLFGTTLRVPGDFFVSASHPDVNAPAFVAELRTLINRLRAAPGSRHLPPRTPFFHADLRTCTHVFRRVDTVRSTLQPPYTGPHRVIRRIDDQRYVVEVNGEARTLSTSSLKPAYLEVADQPPSTAPLPARASPSAAVPAPPPAAPSAQATPPAAPSAQAHHPSSPEAGQSRGSPAGPSTQAPFAPTPSVQPRPAAPSPAPAPPTPPPPLPPASSSLNRQPRKTVSFRTEATSGTGGGVAVAPRAGQQRRQRKQTLIPRPDYD